jgi:ssDNA-binding Zn-finger/Zn-ribbon topoisomerase 1
MSKYQCNRCGYSTSSRQALSKHFQRKRVCNASLADIPIADLQSELERKVEDMSHRCEKCGKGFAHASSKYRHRKICQNAVAEEKISNLETELALMKQQLQNMQTMQQSNVTINNTTNNVQITNINALGKEDTRHLTHAFLSKCLKRTHVGVIDLLEKLHFDTEVNNRNVRCSNKKLPLLEFNNGERWHFARKDVVLNQMLDKGCDILESHYEDTVDELKDDVSQSMFEYIAEWVQKMTDRDKSTIEPVLTDIYCLLLNNS